MAEITDKNFRDLLSPKSSASANSATLASNKIFSDINKFTIDYNRICNPFVTLHYFLGYLFRYTSSGHISKIGSPQFMR